MAYINNQNVQYVHTLQLVQLPEVVVEMILSNLTYDEISKSRIVCKLFDQICKKLLNRGFTLMEKYHRGCLRAVKSQLPRRESERRSHPLASHCDILSAIETRISMLTMTFTKYIDLNLCCFIPGKVIDEIFRILRLVKVSKTPPRTPEILQELRDISSMAIEHFDEKILPDLRHSICSTVNTNVNTYDLPTYVPGRSLTISPNTSSGKSSLIANTYSTDKLSQTFKKIYSCTKKNKTSVLSAKEQISKMKLSFKRQSFQLSLQNIKLQEHVKKLHDQDVQMADMRKRLEDWEQKLGDLSAEFSRAREEVQNPGTIDGCKMHLEIPSTSAISKDIQAKKRKLIVERKSSTDAQDVKFKKFMSELLSETSLEDASNSH